MSNYERDIEQERLRNLNVTVGRATVPFCGMSESWVKIGGEKINSKIEAIAYAKNLNAVLRK